MTFSANPSYRKLVLALILSAAFAVFANTTPAAAASRHCGTVSAQYKNHKEGGSLVKITRVKRVSCARARRLVKTCIERGHVPGWRGQLSFDEAGSGYLRRGRRYVYITPIGGGGANCLYGDSDTAE